MFYFRVIWESLDIEVNLVCDYHAKQNIPENEVLNGTVLSNTTRT